MKKLTLKFDGMKDMLTREQMKKVNGGEEDPTSSSSGSSGSESFSSCHAKCNVPAKGVTCKGDGCGATDYVGCQSASGFKKCKS